MKVILLEDVNKVGKKDQVLEVKEGYGRNYLIKNKLAVEATPANLKELQRQEGIRAAKAAEVKAEAEEMAKQLKDHIVTIRVKSGAGGKLFGAVTAKEVAEVLEKETGLKIDKRKIELGESIKTMGQDPTVIKLHPQVNAHITVKVTDLA